MARDFEETLVERITLREAISELTERERGVIVALYRHNQTLRAAAQDAGISAERVRQISYRALRRLRRRLELPPIPPPPAAAAPEGFDKKAFLTHMRGVAAERAARDTGQPRWVQLAAYQRATGGCFPFDKPPQTEPRKAALDPLRLQRMADEANALLLRWRINHLLRPDYGLPELGARQTSVEYWATRGCVEEAIRRLLEAIPSDARFAACAKPMPPDTHGATSTNHYAAVLLLAREAFGDVKYSFEVTWSGP